MSALIELTIGDRLSLLERGTWTSDCSRRPMNDQIFTELLQLNARALNRFVLGMVGNQSDADDIVQETAVKAFIHFGDLRVQAKFRTWLMSIAVNEVRTRRRTESRSRVSYLDFDQLERLGSASNDSPYHRYEEHQIERSVRKAIVSLHPRYKEMIRMRAIDGLDIAETAHRLSISIPAAKTRYYRAVECLSRVLAQQNRKPVAGALAHRIDVTTKTHFALQS